ncbi:MAG: hypothetical protein HY951_17785 [Bacteroidia bacterium]|nr:hypothetical protein [Bacteroidia bacterium]
MKRCIKLSVGLVLFLIVFSCRHKDDEVSCTSMFASVGIEVNGGTLDSYFTIRNSTHDTIRFTNGVFQNLYTVLDDNYLQIIKNKQENFKFIGVKSGNIVVDENFVISADECHISKVSGVNSVNI